MEFFRTGYNGAVTVEYFRYLASGGVQMQQPKLHVRFFLSYLQLILILVIVFSIFFFQYTSSVLIDRETATIVNLASYLQTQTDQAVKVMDNVSINIGYSNLVLFNLENYFASPKHSREETKYLADHFVALNGTEIQVEQMNVYHFSGEVVGFGKSNIQSFTVLGEKSWYLQTLSRKGRKFLSLPYTSEPRTHATSTRNYFISLYRTYTNRFGKQVGIIETVQAYNTIFKSLIQIEKANPAAPALYVFNEDQQLIFPFESDAQSDPSVPTGYLEKRGETSDHVLVRNPVTGAKELVAYQHSPYTGWTFMIVQPERIILEPVYRMVMVLVGVVIVLLLAASLLSYSLSLRLARPIRELHDIICDTELETLGDQPQQPLQDGFTEVEELNTAFHAMSSKLKKSKDDMVAAQKQEMKARSVALQAQVNPHFYYNSLASIIVLAKKGMNDSIIQLCQNLTSIMRYVSNIRKSQVSLAEEINYLEQYLFCMKVRYQDSLVYKIAIDPEIEAEMIPKLLIQPLVENALKYGTNCPPPWRIEVKGRRLESGWLIEVLDEGPGFTTKALNQWAQTKEEIDKGQGIPESGLGGMGLANVYARWKLYAGPEGYIHCENHDSGGARIQIGRTGMATDTDHEAGEPAGADKR